MSTLPDASGRADSEALPSLSESLGSRLRRSRQRRRVFLGSRSPEGKQSDGGGGPFGAARIGDDTRSRAQAASIKVLRHPARGAVGLLISRTAFRLAPSFPSTRDSLGVPRRELLRHGSTRLHANLAQIFMTD